MTSGSQATSSSAVRGLQLNSHLLCTAGGCNDGSVRSYCGVRQRSLMQRLACMHWVGYYTATYRPLLRPLRSTPELWLALKVVNGVVVYDISHMAASLLYVPGDVKGNKG